MTVERRRLTVSGPGGSHVVDVSVSIEPPWSLSVTLPDGREMRAEAEDLFAALLEVREQLERDGLLVCIEGARPDVWPSGMSSQMSGGRFAYRLRPGAPSRRDDLVNVFDPTPCEDVVTVRRQREAVEQLRGR